MLDILIGTHNAQQCAAAGRICIDFAGQAAFAGCPSAQCLPKISVFVEGPQIITVRQFDTPRRYWIVPFLDAYYNYYGAIGSDYNSSSGQYLVVGRSRFAKHHFCLFGI